MKLKFTFIFLMMLAFVPLFQVQAQTCASVSGGDNPLPLGGRAPIPWDKVDGYWSDHNIKEFFYRIEVLSVDKYGARRVAVEVLNDSMTETIATGVGFVRSGSWDLWARAKGDGFDFKIRIQSFFLKGTTDSKTRVLRASVQDMNPEADKCLNRHVLRKLEELEPWISIQAHKGRP